MSSDMGSVPDPKCHSSVSCFRRNKHLPSANGVNVRHLQHKLSIGRITEETLLAR